MKPLGHGLDDVIARKGLVSVSIRGLSDQLPPVVDLTGDDPDPHRLADSDLSIKNGRLGISVDWQHGDSSPSSLSKSEPKYPGLADSS